jgi:aromatic-L-amino-acid decarboxylase
MSEPTVSGGPGPVSDLDWGPERAAGLGHGAVDVWVEYLTALPDLPIHRGFTSEEVGEALAWDVPDQPDDPDRLLADTRELLLDWSMYTGNGGFFGYVSGSGTVPGAVADLLASGLNNNAGGWRLGPGIVELEQRLLRWFSSRLGLPDVADGYLTSGGSAANHDALAVARDVKAGWDVRRLGVGAGPALTAYASTAVHDTIQRGADLLGLGYEAVRAVAVDGNDRVDVAAMEAAIEADLAAGHQPFCVVGTAGTVGVGAIDDLQALADLADRFDLWFHVDGAVGAVGALVDELAHKYAGIEQADSITLDPHKWLYVPIACGMLLVRDGDHLTRAFHIDPSYTVEDREAMGSGSDKYVRSPFFSRPASVLKLWWSLRAHGWDAYARRLVLDCELARHLTALADAHPRLEATNEPELMIGTFRYLPEGQWTDEQVDALNEQLMQRLQYSGEVYPSNAVIDGRFVLRACIVNHRTTAAHIERLITLAGELGDALVTDRPDD